jgi:hypothetical protein
MSWASSFSDGGASSASLPTTLAILSFLKVMRLKSKLLSLNADKAVKVKVYTPANCDEVRIPFKKDKIAKVVGKLAELAPPSDHHSPMEVQALRACRQPWQFYLF